MSDAAAISAAAPRPPQSAAPPSRSFIRRIAGETVARLGARIGLAWIGLIALLAVFAPFIANSRPVLLKLDGQWSSPLMLGFGVSDVWLLVMFCTAAGLLAMRRLDARLRWKLAITISLTSLPAIGWAAWVNAITEMTRGKDEWEWVFNLVEPLTRGPLPRLFTAAFAVLAVVLVVLLLLRNRSLNRPIGFVILAWVSLVAVPWVVAPLTPPALTIYDAYRDAARAGRVDFALHTPIPYSPSDRLRDFPAAGLVAPWWGFRPATDEEAEHRMARFHWLGNESNGADLASRMIHACRIALAIGFIATGIAVVIGVVAGGLMGYYSARVDLIGMRFVEIIEFIPQLFLLLIFVAFFGRNIYLIMVIIGFTSWTGYARFTRAEFLKLRKQDFVQAAIACGLPLRSILFRHMLPNGVTPVLVSASFGVASAILAEATLSFLGLGLVDEPSWGELLNQSVRGTGTFPWWIATFPGGAIFLTVFAYNLIGESLRDAIDPHLKKTAHL